MTTTCVIAAAPAKRMDLFLAGQALGLTRSGAQRLMLQGRVLLNGIPARARDSLTPGDRVEIQWPASEAEAPLPEPISLSILYEDEHLLVIDKPAGMVVHAGAGRNEGAVVNAAIAHRPEIARVGLDPRRAGIVHRLDRDTSGVMVIAASEEALLGLQGQFRRREPRKEYWALVYGQVQPPRGAIEAPLGRDPSQRQRWAVVPEGRYARTEYRVMERLSGASLLEVQLLTGRTHQIRVHLASIGFPIVGDRVYGQRRHTIVAPRQFLHSRRLCFAHPISGQIVECIAPLAPDLDQVLDKLRRLSQR